ncbi:MAG TPA: DUF5668 domain-containing protein [Anaerolineaceae bacterium]
MSTSNFDNKPVIVSGDTSQRPYRRRSIFWPLFLVAAGAVFLLSNLGILTGAGWDFIVRLWPVLIIVGALDGLWRGDGIAGQIFWLGVGVLFLLGNFGYLTVNTWQLILNYWPVLLIALGIDILIGRRAAIWAQALAIVLAVGLLAGIIWLSTTNTISGIAVTSQQISQPMQDVSSANVDLQMPAGDLRLAKGAPADRLVQANLRVADLQSIRQVYSVTNGRADYRLREEGVTVSWGAQNAHYLWDFQLNEKVPTDLSISLGAGQAQVDLTNLDTKSFALNVGVGQTIVTLPNNSDFNGKINTAVGEVVLRVPRNLPVTIRADRAITALSVQSGFQQDGGTITSSGSGGTPAQVSIGTAIGTVRVEYAP